MTLPTAIVTAFWFSILATACGAHSQVATLDKDERAVSGRLGTTGDSFLLDSTLLGESRRIDVATPRSYRVTRADRRYPVIFVLDGESNFALTVTAAQYLADQGQIPEALIVGVENVGDDRERVRDMTPPGLSVNGSGINEGGDRFLDFLEKELAPALGRQFRAAAPNVIVGHSSGGILATWAAATRAASFPFIVAIDAPVTLQDGWLADRLVDVTGTNPASRLHYATLESRFGWTNEAWAALQSAAPAHWRLYRETLAHESHNSMVLLATYLGLREVFAEYSMLSAPESPTSASLHHYDQLNQTLGLALTPPRPLLTRVIDDLLAEGRADLAQTAFRTLLDGYGDAPDAAAIRARIAEAETLPPLTLTVEEMLRQPMPDKRQIAPYLGDWEGTSQAFDDPPRPVRLRIELVDGKVRAAWSHWPEPEVERSHALQYLKLVEGGLHFGFMNGMRPRGMITYEGVFHDGKLQGEMHMRGIRVADPDAFPRVRFSLKLTKPAGD